MTPESLLRTCPRSCSSTKFPRIRQTLPQTWPCRPPGGGMGTTLPASSSSGCPGSGRRANSSAVSNPGVVCAAVLMARFSSARAIVTASPGDSSDPFFRFCRDERGGGLDSSHGRGYSCRRLAEGLARRFSVGSVQFGAKWDEILFQQPRNPKRRGVGAPRSETRGQTRAINRDRTERACSVVVNFLHGMDF